MKIGENMDFIDELLNKEELTDEEFAEFKTANEIAEDVTKDTKDKDVKDKYAAFASQKISEEQAAAAAEQQAALTESSS